MNPGLTGDGIPYGYGLLQNNTVYNCSAGLTALIITQTGGWLTVSNVSFVNNFGLNTGSIALADESYSQIVVNNCTFSNNYSPYGGVFYAQ